MSGMRWHAHLLFVFSGTIPENGVPDMTRLTVLDEEVINKNLRVRYEKDRIYVSFIFINHAFCQNTNTKSYHIWNLNTQWKSILILAILVQHFLEWFQWTCGARFVTVIVKSPRWVSQFAWYFLEIRCYMERVYIYVATRKFMLI